MKQKIIVLFFIFFSGPLSSFLMDLTGTISCKTSYIIFGLLSFREMLLFGYFCGGIVGLVNIFIYLNLRDKSKFLSFFIPVVVTILLSMITSHLINVTGHYSFIITWIFCNTLTYSLFYLAIEVFNEKLSLKNRKNKTIIIILWILLFGLFSAILENITAYTSQKLCDYLPKITFYVNLEFSEYLTNYLNDYFNFKYVYLYGGFIEFIGIITYIILKDKSFYLKFFIPILLIIILTFIIIFCSEGRIYNPTIYQMFLVWGLFNTLTYVLFYLIIERSRKCLNHTN